MPPRIGREPPAAFLAELRTILPTVDLLNIDAGASWWLMDYVPNPARQAHYQRLYDAEYDRIKEGQPVRTHVLATLDWGRQGYVLIGRYVAVDGELPVEQIRNELHVKARATARELEAAYQATEAASTNGAKRAEQEANWKEYVALEGPSIFKHARGRPMVTHPGLPEGP